MTILVISIWLLFYHRNIETEGVLTANPKSIHDQEIKSKLFELAEVYAPRAITLLSQRSDQMIDVFKYSFKK